jgi:murein L,D-transpeptidase YcbB/YkuD
MTPNLLISYPSRFFVVALVFCFVMNSCELEENATKAKGNKTVIETSSFDLKKVVNYLTTTFDSASQEKLVVKGDTIRNNSIWKKVYQSHEYLPFWISEDGITQNVTDYIQVLKEIKYDGLDADHYYLNQIESSLELFKINKVGEGELNQFEVLMTKSFMKLSNDMLLGYETTRKSNKDWKNKNDSLVDFGIILAKSIEHGDMQKSIDVMRPNHPYYRAFRKEYIRLDSIRTNGNWPKITILKDSISVGDSNEKILELRRRLFSEIGSPTDTLSMLWADDIVQSIRKFQYLHHLKPSGKIDSVTLNKLNIGIDSKLKSLALNMERMRWMKHDFSQPYIWVDVPKMELDYIERDSIKFNMRVVVGRPSRTNNHVGCQA